MERTALNPSEMFNQNPFLMGAANALSGATGGVLAMSLIYPLDVVRCRLQAGADKNEERKEEKDDDEYNEDNINDKLQKRNEIIECIMDIYENEGIPGFYRALDSQLFGIFFGDIIYFFWFSYLKQKFYHTRNVSPFDNLKVSIIAGIINVVLTHPYWTAQTQMMLQKKKQKTTTMRFEDISNKEYKNVFDAFYQIYENNGWRGLFKGVGPSLWLVSNPIILFVVYEWLVLNIKKWQNTEQLSSITYFICGAIGKAAATYATYPLQVMKTQLQKRDSQFESMSDSGYYLLQRVKQGDINAMYAGLSAKLYQTVLNSAIKFAIYENVLRGMKYLLGFLFLFFASYKRKIAQPS